MVYVGRLTSIIDILIRGEITIDGKTSLSFSEDIPMRFKSCGWNTLVIEDGNNDLEAITHSLRLACNSDKPTIICLKTYIGYKSPLENSEKAHGSPLGEDGVSATKKALGMDPEKSFYVSEEVTKFYSDVKEKGDKAYNDWKKLLNRYSDLYPDDALEYKRIFIENTLPSYWKKGLKAKHK